MFDWLKNLIHPKPSDSDNLRDEQSDTPDELRERGEKYAKGSPADADSDGGDE